LEAGSEQVDAKHAPFAPVMARLGDPGGTVPALADAVLAAAAGPGYLVLEDVFERSDTDLRLLGHMQDFFALPDADPNKQSILVTGRKSTHGYMPLYGEPAYEAGTRARVESFDCGLPGRDEPGVWPALPGFRAAVTDGWRSLSDAGFSVLRAVSGALGLPADCLGGFCGTQATSTMRLLHYPGGVGTPESPGETGISAHTDFECITLLYQTAPGLELRDREGRWQRAPAGGRQVVVLFGDMLERFTNGRIHATPHRVALTREPRFSIVLFFAVDDGIRVGPLPELLEDGEIPRYARVTQRAHSTRKLTEATRNRDAQQDAS